MDLILTNSSGNEIRTIRDAELDMDLGATNDFVLTVLRSDYPNDITDKCRIFRPGSEFGGLIRRKGTRTADNTVTFGGYTWRGLLQHKIIQPDAGQNYKKVTGELNTVIASLVDSEFSGLFVTSSEDTGVSVSNYQFERYCTLLDGLKKMLLSVGYRLDIEYVQGTAGAAGYVSIGAVPIVDYSSQIELSSDMRFDYSTQVNNDGVNHLICLGEGELKDRVVRHLYVQADGTVSTSTQYYTGLDEIVDVYNFPGADAATLLEYGDEALREVESSASFDMKVLDISFDVAIGDIVGGRDYITGIVLAKPVTNKIWKYKNGTERVEYSLDNLEEY